MKTTKDLLTIIKNENILYDQVELPKNILGYYESNVENDCILISDSNSMRANDSLMKCVLAEEVGHYFTCIGINEPLDSNTYYHDLMIEKQEMKALKWATDYLLDTDLMLNFLADYTLAKVHDIAEHFQVTEDFVLQKLEFMKRKKEYWKLKDKIYLCLSSLPTIFIADIWDDKFIDF